MRAVVQDRYGSADVLELADIEVPAPGEGEVLVRVGAAGVDQSVWHLMTGLPYAVRPAFGLRRPRQRVLGRSLAGVVTAVGTGVTRLAAGDEVFGTGVGTWAKYAVAPEGMLALRPDALTVAQAAAVPDSGQTALEAVRAAGDVTGGQRVLVIGAGGGVGSFAVQLAKASGAHVTGMASAGKLEAVRSLGADDVVDHAVEEVDGRGRCYDVVIDTAGNRSLSLLRRALTPRGTLVLVGGEAATGPWLRGFDRQLRALAVSPFVRERLVPVMSKESVATLEILSAQAQSGALVPLLERTWELEEAADAIRHLEAGHALGKSVLTP